MTRFIVEYRRWCQYTDELTEWTNYYTTHDINRATEMYAQHVSQHPKEEVRMISFIGDALTHYSFDPTPEEDAA
jgi:hypothetical protein